ncbi:class I SAM-dependent methyltransferase [Gemmatimonas sp.]|uniref:class I SAM-dependent methyltransferase n=1 Tax=Gemmatimonas sp. TaxID=1962908 RepID=UPI00398323A0
MDPRLQRRVQRYGWDKAAAHYETYWRRQLEPVQSQLLRQTSAQRGESVLDVACGTGLVTFPVAEQVGSTGSVLGVDLSEGMIAGARTIAEKRGIANARFERMDAELLALEDATFDAALCALGLMYVPDPRRALAEMHRVVKPGGRVVASVWGRRVNCGWAEIFSIVDARVSSEVCPMFFQLGNGTALQDEFAAVGFTHITTERISAQLRYATADDACGAAFDGGPVALAASRFDDIVRAQVREEYLASIDAYRDGTGFAIPGEFVLVSGHRA